MDSWVDETTAEILVQAGIRLGIDKLPGWQAVLDYVEKLKARACLLHQTFNYEDFARENLALARGRVCPPQAVVFDYDCFTIGMATAISAMCCICWKGMSGMPLLRRTDRSM